MQRLEVSSAVRPIYGSLGVKRLKRLAVRRDLSSAVAVHKRVCLSKAFYFPFVFCEHHRLWLRCKSLSRCSVFFWCTKSIIIPVSRCQGMSCLASGSLRRMRFSDQSNDTFLKLRHQFVCLFVCSWRCSPPWVRASSFTRFLTHTQRRASR